MRGLWYYNIVVLGSLIGRAVKKIVTSDWQGDALSFKDENKKF